MRQPRPQGLLGFQYGGGRQREDPFLPANAIFKTEETLGTKMGRRFQSSVSARRVVFLNRKHYSTFPSSTGC